MVKKYNVFLVFVVSMCFTTSANTQQISSKGFHKERLAKLESFIESYIREGKVPNAVVMIKHKNSTIMHKAFGSSNLETKQALKTNDIFRIASQSKLATSLCVLMLMEDGYFHLDEPISKFIPSFKQPKVLVEHNETNLKDHKVRPAKGEITIRHLLTHTSGIPYFHPLEKLSEYQTPYFCSTQNLSIKETVDIIASRPLMADPGEKFVYGLSTDVLGRLVEVVSGKTLDAFMRERLFLPLSMTDTYFYLPQEKQSRLVELYSLSKVGDALTKHTNEEYRNFSINGAKTYFSGGAGLVSTTEDYTKLCELVLHKGEYAGKRLLSRRTMEMLFQNQIGDLEVWDRKDKFSLGLQVSVEGSRYLDVCSIGSLMWGGMYCSEFTIDPEEDLIMVVFTNVEPYAYYSEFLRKCRVLTYQALE